MSFEGGRGRATETSAGATSCAQRDSRARAAGMPDGSRTNPLAAPAWCGDDRRAGVAAGHGSGARCAGPHRRARMDRIMCSRTRRSSCCTAASRRGMSSLVHTFPGRAAHRDAGLSGTRSFNLSNFSRGHVSPRGRWRPPFLPAHTPTDGRMAICAHPQPTPGSLMTGPAWRPLSVAASSAHPATRPNAPPCCAVVPPARPLGLCAA